MMLHPHLQAIIQSILIFLVFRNNFFLPDESSRFLRCLHITDYRGLCRH